MSQHDSEIPGTTPSGEGLLPANPHPSVPNEDATIDDSLESTAVASALTPSTGQRPKSTYFLYSGCLLRMRLSVRLCREYIEGHKSCLRSYDFEVQ